MRRARLLLPPLLGLAFLIALTHPTHALEVSASGAAPATPVDLSFGRASVLLAGPWKFAPGDSPRADDGSLLWASPSFDDTGWVKMNLRAQPGARDAVYGNSGYFAGWTERGFPHLAGYAWYRLRVHVANSSGPLWIKMPDHVDDSYQVFANGQYVGELGQFTAKGVVSYRSRPLAFALPPPDKNGDIVLAIRFYMDPSTLFTGSTGDTGGMHQAPLLGLRAPIESALSREVTGRILTVIVPVFVSLLTLIAAVGAFRIWLLDRPSTTYLWLTLGLVLAAATSATTIVAFFTYVLNQGASNVLLTGVPVLSFLCWVLFWRRWFELKRNRGLDIAIIALTAACVGFEGLGWLVPSITSGTSFLALKLSAGCAAMLGAVLVVSLLQGARKDRTGALVVLIPILLLAISLFSGQLIAWFHIRTSFFPFGVQIGVKDVAMTLMVLVVGALVARRFLNSQVSQRLERQAVEQEMEQARELQQRVLVSETLHAPQFSVEAEYRPAQTVGGDFFQTLSRPNGSLLVVIGDVSGKGISAAMLVAVLVGAIRSRARESFEPGAILEVLNACLMGRSGGHFATCAAAEMGPDGQMRIANAGHLPPYLNGKEMELEGSLPLGVVAEAEYTAQTFTLQPGDRLTFMTDGVVEATNPVNELFGFERTREISGRPAAAIADEAQRFGQEDDITVLAVEFSAA
jgi:Stage II sporulation protein E (SpoIIE)